MPLTADQIAEVLNRNGVDSPEKFEAFIGRAAASLQVTAIEAQIAQAKLDRDAANQEVETHIQGLQQALTAAQRVRDGLE